MTPKTDRLTRSSSACGWLLLLALFGCEQTQDLGHGLPEPCRPGLSRCDTRCVDPFLDPSHCGECGHACPTGKLCQAGACVDSCSPPNSACSGSCVTLYENDLHCGRCNQACPESQHCDNAVCVFCAAGNRFCPSQSQRSWRCVNVALDTLNCGDCGKTCAAGQQCIGGTCR